MNANIAGKKQRFYASLIDGLLFLPLYALDEFMNAYQGSATVTFLYFLVSQQEGWLYSTLFHGWRGQTPGKMVMRIRVVRYPDGGPLGWGRAIRRDSPYIALILVTSAVWIAINVAYFTGSYTSHHEALAGRVFTVISYSVLIWALLEIITLLLHPQRRAIHDLIAGSIVIKSHGRRECHV